MAGQTALAGQNRPPSCFGLLRRFYAELPEETVARNTGLAENRRTAPLNPKGRLKGFRRPLKQKRNIHGKTTHRRRHQRCQRFPIRPHRASAFAAGGGCGNAPGGVQRGGADKGAGNGFVPRRSVRAGRRSVSGRQPGRPDCQRFVSNAGNAGRPLLDADAGGRGAGLGRQPFDAGGGCCPERAAAAGVDGARNAAEFGTSGQYAAGNGNGRHRFPARPRLLPQAAKRRRYSDPQRRPRLGIVRIGNPEPAPLGESSE